LAVAVRAYQPQVLDAIVRAITVNVIHTQYERLAAPLLAKPADLAAPLQQSDREQPFLQTTHRRDRRVAHE